MFKRMAFALAALLAILAAPWLAPPALGAQPAGPRLVTSAAGTPTPTATALNLCWQVRAPVPLDVANPGVDSDGTYVYAAGGYRNSGGALTQLARYDPVANSWTTLAPMPDNAFETWTVYVAGKLYVFGGGYYSSGLRVVVNHTRIYDIASNSWSYAAPMPGPRRVTAGGHSAGKIYLVGGLSGDADPATMQNQTWEYTIATNVWAVKTPFPFSIGSPAAEILNDRLYIVGGRNQSGTNLNSVYEYDPVANTWTARAAMPTTRNYPGSTVANNLVWVFGGGIGSGGLTPLAVTERYDATTNTWSPGPAQNVPRVHQGGARVGNYLVSVGGHGGAGSSAVTEVLDLTYSCPSNSTPTATATTTTTPSPTATTTPGPTATTTPGPTVTTTPSPTATLIFTSVQVQTLAAEPAAGAWPAGLAVLLAATGLGLLARATRRTVRP